MVASRAHVVRSHYKYIYIYIMYTYGHTFFKSIILIIILCIVAVQQLKSTVERQLPVFNGNRM